MLDLLLSDALLIVYPLLPVSVLVFWDSRVDRMSTTSDVGEMKSVLLFWICYRYRLLKFAPSTSAGAACAVSWGQTVVAHRDQGTTRGQQQQSSSLQTWPPPSPATPGPKKRGKAEYGEREGAGGWWAGRREDTKNRKTRRRRRMIWSILQQKKEPPPHCCPLGKSSLLPLPRDNSGPISTAPRALVLQKTV